MHGRRNILRIRLNIILASTPRLSKWPLSHRSPHQNPVCISPLPNTCYMTRTSHSSLFDDPSTVW